ncbi:MAG TPA: ANTAR domain-containing protein [Candidatus Binatia bacterium]|nr:ANTAR domain-containing protein [Candidatus Binatia bacterium]
MRRVLVIDDHEPSRKNVFRVLAESGFEVAGDGTSGAGALELSLATNPEVVLMAVGLADMDGIRAARRIMQAHPLPSILLTSHFDAVTIERAKRAGIMGYLVKPLRASELAPAIELAVAHFEEFIALRKENQGLKKTLEARKIIERAKGILMENQGLSEADAFALIKRKSMELRKPMAEIAQAILLYEEIVKTSKG